MNVCLFPVIAMQDGGYKYLLIRRKRAHPGDLREPCHNLLQPAVSGVTDHTSETLQDLYHFCEVQGGHAFAQMMREKEATIRALPPIYGNPDVRAYAVGILMMEAHVFGPKFGAQKDNVDILWLTADEALAIEPIEVAEAVRGLPPDSFRMLPHYYLALREVIAWYMGQ